MDYESLKEGSQTTSRSVLDFSLDYKSRCNFNSFGSLERQGFALIDPEEN